VTRIHGHNEGNRCLPSFCSNKAARSQEPTVTLLWAEAVEKFCRLRAANIRNRQGFVDVQLAQLSGSVQPAVVGKGDR